MSITPGFKRALVVSMMVLAAWAALMVASTLGAGELSALPADFTPTAYIYVPLVAKPYTCPVTSTREYSAGTAYQYDKDDPVRPAYNHADKNIELRGYTLNPEPGLKRDLIDLGSHDEKAPQLATLFNPERVPEFISLYRVHNWTWEPSPDPGTRGAPIGSPDVTALGMGVTPGEALHVPESDYSIGGDPPMEVIVLFADQDTIALRYAREDTIGGPDAWGYTIHVDNICVDPNLLALYNELDDPNGPRYEYVPREDRPYAYDLPNLYAGQPFGIARSTEIVVAVVDTGAFLDARSCRDWWQIRPGYGDDCNPG